MKEVKMSHSKVPKLLIVEMLIRETLKDFYATFVKHHGEGMILNYIGGSKLYDIIKDDIEIDVDTKKELWKNSKTSFVIKSYKVCEESKKKQLEDIFKSKIVEWHLRRLALSGQVLEI